MILQLKPMCDAAFDGEDVRRDVCEDIVLRFASPENASAFTEAYNLQSGLSFGLEDEPDLDKIVGLALSASENPEIVNIKNLPFCDVDQTLHMIRDTIADNNIAGLEHIDTVLSDTQPKSIRMFSNNIAMPNVRELLAD